MSVTITCPKHNTPMICPACLGEATSKAKAAASRANGRLGGRPRGSKDSRKRQVRATRAR